MSLHFLRGHPNCLIYLQWFYQEINRCFTDIMRDERFDGDCFYLSFEIIFSFSSPWSFTCQHFVEDHSNCPDITFGAIDIIIQCLQRHVNGTSNVVIWWFLKIAVLNCKSKISNFDFSTREEYIGWFEISVYNAEFIQVTIASDNLLEDTQCLTLRHSFPSFDDFS